MSTVGLLYVGAVLFVNSMMLLGKVESKSAGIFNLFVGGLQVFTPLYIIMTADGDPWTIFSASGLFLFGFTYLYVGIGNLIGADSTGVGWYSLWVAIMAVGYSLVNFIQFQDVKFGIIWLMWSFLWYLFYLLLAQGKDIGRFTGWVTFIQSWITCTIPAFLIMIDSWSAISSPTGVIIGIGLFIVFGVLYFQHRGSAISNADVGA